jgi:endonuclease YncB( thermonuclease family)
MAEPENRAKVTLQELIVATLSMTDALSKLLIEKGVITDEEFKQKLSEKRATYQTILKSVEQWRLQTLTRYPFKYIEEFRRLEREARQEGRGLWQQQ